MKRLENQSMEKQRLRQFIRKTHPQFSLSYIRSIIEAGQVKVNGHVANPSAWVNAQDVVVIEALLLRHELLPNLDVDCQLLQKTRDYIFFHKGIRVHSVAQSFEDVDTVANWLVALDPAQREVSHALESGVAHRLDFETSGVMVAARHKRAYTQLRKLFASHKITKEYECFVSAEPPAVGSYRAFVKSSSKNSVRVKLSKQHSTNAILIKTLILETKHVDRNRWWIKIGLVTGFRHQIRAHLALLGCPIIGDEIYGGAPAKRLMLHSTRIAFSDRVVSKQNFDVVHSSKFS